MSIVAHRAPFPRDTEGLLGSRLRFSDAFRSDGFLDHPWVDAPMPARFVHVFAEMQAADGNPAFGELIIIDDLIIVSSHAIKNERHDIVCAEQVRALLIGSEFAVISAGAAAL